MALLFAQGTHGAGRSSVNFDQFAKGLPAVGINICPSDAHILWTVLVPPGAEGWGPEASTDARHASVTLGCESLESVLKRRWAASALPVVETLLRSIAKHPHRTLNAPAACHAQL